MARDPSETSVLTIYGQPDGDGYAVCARSDKGAREVESCEGGKCATTRFEITSGDDCLLVDVYWPSDSGAAGAFISVNCMLPEGWDAEFCYGDTHPLGWLVLGVPLDAVVKAT